MKFRLLDLLQSGVNTYTAVYIVHTLLLFYIPPTYIILTKPLAASLYLTHSYHLRKSVVCETFAFSPHSAQDTPRRSPRVHKVLSFRVHTCTTRWRRRDCVPVYVHQAPEQKGTRQGKTTQQQRTQCARATDTVYTVSLTNHTYNTHLLDWPTCEERCSPTACTRARNTSPASYTSMASLSLHSARVRVCFTATKLVLWVQGSRTTTSALSPMPVSPYSLSSTPIHASLRLNSASHTHVKQLNPGGAHPKFLGPR